ncbi:MAG TPA: hypothetical protein VM241_06095 [Candidatus Thermoplasmatota archaeon]|jgi:hypothetical protein|nr:hypothetical protein [Candidatus Thermoplasmatota archaeon]
MGRKPAPKGTRRSPRASLGITWGLADEIDALVREPRFGFTDRNDFANRACAKLVEECRGVLFEELVAQAIREGRPTPLEELRKLGFRLPAQENAGSPAR